MADLARRLVRGQEGATATEYAMMVALVGSALVAAVTSLGRAIGGPLSSISRSIGANPTTPALPIAPSADAAAQAASVLPWSAWTVTVPDRPAR
jgi:Flp pilus assembly pilin Flp